MSEEERKDQAPEPGPEDAVDRLGEDLGDTADSLTRDLRDLQDEMLPPETFEHEDALAGETMPAPDALDEMAFGASTGEEPLLLPPPATASRPAAAAATFTPEGTDDDRLMSMLAWLSMVILQLPIVSIIQLLSANSKDRPFQRHHAVTSLLFFGAAVAYEVIASVVFTILTAVTLGCAGLCLWVIFFVPHALGLYFAFQAYGGKRIHLKYLSDWARQQGWL